MDDFVLLAALGGVGVAVVTAPLGCFVVWRRMAYFGATLSHAALLGIAAGLLLGVDLHLGVMAVGALVAVALFALERTPSLATDTLLGILAHACLALGLVLISFMENVRVDLMAYLFGDILAVSHGDLLWIAIGGALCLAVLVSIWRPLLAMTVHEELARVEGVPVERLRLLFLLLTALAVAVAMQVVGLLLTVSLLILPPAAARRLVSTPEAMALGAVGVGVASVLAGLWSSLTFDTPAGPSIVVAASIIFVLTLPCAGMHAPGAR